MLRYSNLFGTKYVLKSKNKTLRYHWRKKIKVKPELRRALLKYVVVSSPRRVAPVFQCLHGHFAVIMVFAVRGLFG